MPISVLKAPDAERMARVLNGLVLGRTNLSRGKDPGPANGALYKHPVSGKTLIFTTPAALTVTFASDRTMSEIVSDINTAAGKVIAHLYKTGDNGEQNLALWDDTTPVKLSHTGTANPYLGFSVTAADPSLTQNVIAPTDIIEIVCEPLSRQYVAFIMG